MSQHPIALTVVAAAGLLVSCGTDGGRATDLVESAEVTATTVDRSGTAVAARPAASRAPEAEVPVVAPPVPRLAAVELEQTAVWPAADVVFATPEEAATDFVSSVFGVDPVLGTFRAGDQRSGEIDVLFEGEGNGAAQPLVNSTLAMRRLAPTDGWFVLFGINESVSITAPESGTTVAPGAVTVEGAARGFEGTVLVSAFAAGDAGSEIDRQIARGGPLATPEPYSATLDLSSAAPGSTAILVRGDTGVSADTGEFSVVPVIVADTAPASTLPASR